MNGRKWISLLALIWLTTVISLYYVNHKPFEISFVLRLLTSAWQMSVSILVVLLGGGIGYIFMPDIEIHPLIRMVLQVAMGLGVIALTVFLIGWLFGLNSIMAWSMLVIGSLLLRKGIVNWSRSLAGLVAIWKVSSKTGKLIAIEVGAVLLATLFIALAPPIRFDALVYHLALPELYLTTGKITYIPQNMFWGMPQSGEMLYTFVTAMAGIEAATTLGWLVAALALIGVLGFAAEKLSVQSGWVAVASLLAGATLGRSISAGYIDWLALVFGLCTLVALDRWGKKGEFIWLVYAGLFSGLALGTKYTAGVILLSGIGVIIWRTRHNLKQLTKNLTIYVLPGIGISLAWWVKNLITTGNPFYPFFYPSGSMDAFRLSHYHLPPWGDIFESVLLPLKATFNGVEGTPGYSTSIGPLILGLVPLVWLGWKNRTAEQQQTLKTSVIIGILGVLTWAIASRFSGYLIQSRLYFAFFPALSVVAAGGYLSMVDLRWFGIRFGRIAGILILLVFSFSILQLYLEAVRQGAFITVVGLQTKEEYLDDNLGWYAPAMRAVRDLSEGSKVLMLWEPRSLYCLPRCFPDEILDRWLHERHLSGSNEEILNKWMKAGYTHLMLNQFGADFIRNTDHRYSSDDWQSLKSMLAFLPEPDNFGDSYYLYPLKK